MLAIYMKNMINRKDFETLEEIQVKLDLYMLRDRITTDEYDELYTLANDVYTVKEEIVENTDTEEEVV